jgi:hypothetical protein
MADQVLHPYKTEKVTVLRALILIFLDNKQENRRFWTEL